MILVERQNDRQIDQDKDVKFTDRQINLTTDRQNTDKQTDKQTTNRLNITLVSLKRI